MTGLINLGMVLGLLAGLLAAMAGLKRLATARDWHPELSRKIIHVGAGSLACALPWLLPQEWQVWLLLGLTASAMLALRLGALGGIGTTLHGVERQSWGDFLLVLAVALIFLLHGGVAVFYLLPIAILTLADAAAALAGIRYGRVFFTTEDGRKSLEGSAMFFLVALILSMICLLLLTDTARPNVITISFGIAAFATALEADSWQGFDNLFLPMGVYILLLATLEVEPGTAALRIALILAAATATFLISRATGSGRHVARVHAMAVFCVLAVVYPLNAILPALAMLVPAALRTAPEEPRDALAFVGFLALLSFIYLAVESATGFTAINFFGLACAALAAAHIGQVLARPVWAALAAGGLAVLWFVVLWLNPPPADWHGAVAPVGAVLILAAALWPSLRPASFTPQPVLRLGLLGALPPSLLLAFEITRMSL